MVLLCFKKYLFKEDKNSKELSDIFNEIMLEIAYMMINSKPGEKIHWEVVPSARIKKIYQDYVRYGIIRDYKGVFNIRDIIVKNILKLYWCNAFNGHDNFDPVEDLENFGDFNEYQIKKIKKVIDDGFLSDNKGTLFVSDYGLPKLIDLVKKIYEESEPEKIFLYIDQILNVAHRRNDLSSWFIEGGKKTLDDIRDYGFHEEMKESIRTELFKMKYHGNKILEKHNFG